ncbi:TPA: hypothetical protein IX819_001923 [Enterococcus faecium]|nr:hypothetical protein [Enterococcus faecium]HAQ6422311.1 hypothetical protein [Enterococcus faecium]HAQ6562638.1 hypothetical protein [Enterococcus faecium]HAQ6966448.1 hypothetical protein [Enterococcus faecium]HAQ7901409.1 hypothetical protein [Enterococcus faecium]
MKKIFGVSVGLLMMLTFGNAVYAAEKEVISDPEQYASRYFADFEEEDKVLALPEGGFLKGEAKIVSMDNPDIIQGSYNSETDPASVSVTEAKKIVAEKFKNDIETTPIMPRGAFPPDVGTSGHLLVLAGGGSYKSQPFSGAGWRFGGMGVKPADGTGNFLRWKSYIDDGRVGNVNQANATKSGSIQGMALYAREGFKYFAPNGPGWTMNIGIYYTYNPAAGTYYVVQNI